MTPYVGGGRPGQFTAFGRVVAGSEHIEQAHLGEAIGYRRLDRTGEIPALSGSRVT